MAENAVRLTNHRDIPMLLPDGQGNRVNLKPKESKVVFGDYAYFKRMPEQGLTGLSVKLEKGMQRLVEKAKKDIGLFKITNHRQIPMQLATGMHEGKRNVKIGPGETVEVVARESVVKQMTGISVKEVHPVTKPPKARPIPSPRPATVHQAPPAPTLVKKPSAPKSVTEKLPKTLHRTDEELELEKAVTAPLSPEEAAAVLAIPPAEPVAPLVEDEAPSEPVSSDLVSKRMSLGIPATKEEWEEKSDRYSWHDLRGIAKALGVKGKRRVTLAAGISSTYDEE